jgi:hypothetical protein
MTAKHTTLLFDSPQTGPKTLPTRLLVFRNIPLLLFIAFVTVFMFAGIILNAGVLLQQFSWDHDHVEALVEVPDGQLRIDAVLPEHMAPMHAGKFAQSGMSMAAMGMDMAPEGFRRFTVDFTLASQARSGLHYSADTFRLKGMDMPEIGPLRFQLGNGFVPHGTAVSGSLLFQVPEAANHLELHFDGAARSIAINLEPGTEVNHDHSTQEQLPEQQHSTDDQH